MAFVRMKPVPKWNGGMKGIIEETKDFSRKTVSFQGNKTEVLHSWVKYREGFSSDLVETLLAQFAAGAGDKVLDPFAGSCTTLLVCKMLGIDAVGIELLPNCHLAWAVKSRVFDYRIAELESILSLIRESQPPPTSREFPHLTITESAFPKSTEEELMRYTAWFERLDISEHAQLLCKFLLMSVLEEISYTRKDGPEMGHARRQDHGKKWRAGEERESPRARDSQGTPAHRQRSAAGSLYQGIG